MSFVLSPSIEGTISVFPAAGPFVAGGMYRTASIVQGNLTYEAYGQAISSTTLSDNVIIDNGSGDDGWVGKFNWTTGQLYAVEDNVGNRVEEAANIAAFQWHDANVFGNYLDATSFIDWTGWVAGGLFARNRVSNYAFITFSGVNVDTLNFENNVFEGAVSATFRQGGLGSFTDSRVTNGSNVNIRDFNIDNSEFINGANFNWGQAVDPGNLSMLRSSIDSATLTGSIANLGLALSQTHIIDSSVTFNGATAAVGTDITMTGGLIAAKSQFNFNSGAINADMSFSNFTLLNRGFFEVNGGTKTVPSNIQNFTVQDNSTFLANGDGFDSGSVNISADGSLVVTLATNTVNEVSVISGTLTTAGFDAQGALLIGGSSILIADVTDAFKNAYTNALP